MFRLRKRVVLYIVHEDRVLLMDHVDHPEVPTQLPGGTIESGESPDVAALREASEETGLDGLSVKSMLGSVCLGRDHLLQSPREERVFLQAWYFHLNVLNPGPGSWSHVERFASTMDGPVRLKLYWSSLRCNQHLRKMDTLLLERLPRAR